MDSSPNKTEMKPKLVQEIIDLIIENVNLHHLNKATLSEETSLREGGLQLDSIDILETVVAVENTYNVKIPDAEAGRQHFRTIGTIADFVLSQKKG